MCECEGKKMWAEEKKKKRFAGLELILIDLLAFVIKIYSRNFITSFLYILSFYCDISAKTRFLWMNWEYKNPLVGGLGFISENLILLKFKFKWIKLN